MSYELHIAQLGQQGFCCSQIIMKLALDTEGVENPGLIRSMAGICQGLISGKGTCGAFSGAACLLAYYAAKGDVYEEADERLELMNSQLYQWFEQYCAEQGKTTDCDSLLDGGPPQQQMCGQLIVDCYEQVVNILIKNGFTYGSPDNG